MLRERLNPEVGQIVTKVLGDLSLESAAELLKHRVGREGIRALKRGKIGRAETVRTFAWGFWERLCELYGSEIAGPDGMCTRAGAVEWFECKAGFTGSADPVPEGNALVSTLKHILRELEAGELVDFDRRNGELASLAAIHADGRSTGELARLTELPEKVIRLMLEGVRPTKRDLLQFAAKLDLDGFAAHTLFEAAKYTSHSADVDPGWEPRLFLMAELERLAERWGGDAIDEALPLIEPEYDGVQLSPRQVFEMIQEIEGSLSRVASRLNLPAHRPPTADAEVIKETAREAARETLTHLLHVTDTHFQDVPDAKDGVKARGTIRMVTIEASCDRHAGIAKLQDALVERRRTGLAPISLTWDFTAPITVEEADRIIAKLDSAPQSEVSAK